MGFSFEKNRAFGFTLLASDFGANLNVAFYVEFYASA
jgi:hypothetical protein